VGLDSPADNLAWSDEEGFLYDLWTDDNAVLGVTYGALTGDRDTSVSRVTKLLDANGDLVLEYVDAIDVGTHPAKVLDDCRALFGE